MLRLFYMNALDRAAGMLNTRKVKKNLPTFFLHKIDRIP